MILILFIMNSSFRDSDEVNKELFEKTNATGKMYTVPSVVNGKYCLRLALGSERVKDEDIKETWEIVRRITDDIVFQF